MLQEKLADSDNPITTDRPSLGQDPQDNAPDLCTEKATDSVLTAKELRVLDKSLKKHEAAYRYLGR
jgi:hypothetical protein